MGNLLTNNDESLDFVFLKSLFHEATEDIPAIRNLISKERLAHKNGGAYLWMQAESINLQVQFSLFGLDRLQISYTTWNDDRSELLDHKYCRLSIFDRDCIEKAKEYMEERWNK